MRKTPDYPSPAIPLGGSFARIFERPWPFEIFVAVILVALLPLRSVLPSGLGKSVLSPGVLAAVPLLFVVLHAARRFRWAVPIMVVLGLCLASGFILTTLSSVDHEVDGGSFLAGEITMLSGVFSLAVLLWARTILPLEVVALVYGAGLAAQGALNPSDWEGNPWKFAFALPATIVLLAIINRSTSIVPLVVVCVVLAALCIINGYRSFLGFYAIVMLVRLARPYWPRRLTRAGLAGAAAFIALSILLIYQAGVWLALQGVLGERNQVVTTMQLNQAGSVLLAGRPESGAAVELFMIRPIGFGPGIVPNTSDLSAGQAGLLSRGVNVDGSYVIDYLFGQGIKLHSIVSDLWVNFGLAGLLASALIAIAVVRSWLTRAANSGPDALLTFLAALGLWDLAFGPIGTNFWDLILVVACLLPAVVTDADWSEASAPRISS